MTNHRNHSHAATPAARAACRKARANECSSCRTWAEEAALDNYIDHIGIRIPRTAEGANMARDLTPAEWATVSDWADTLLEVDVHELRIHDAH